MVEGPHLLLLLISSPASEVVHEGVFVKLVPCSAITSVSLIWMLLGGCKSTPEPTPSGETSQEQMSEEHAASHVATRVDVRCGLEDETCRVEHMGSTAFGGVREGMRASAAVKQFGEPTRTEDRFTEEASGDIIEIWTWEDRGITLELLAPDMTADVSTVRAFTLSPPFEAKSERGVGLGSTE